MLLFWRLQTAKMAPTNVQDEKRRISGLMHHQM
jgi:hypothetical protein